jgi:hypothetical protein
MAGATITDSSSEEGTKNESIVRLEEIGRSNDCILQVLIEQRYQIKGNVVQLYAATSCRATEVANLGDWHNSLP